MIKRSKRTVNRRKTAIEIDNFKGGSNLLLDEARLGLNEAKTIKNLLQVQDGLWKPRYGTAYYGVDFGANPDGAFEFVKSDGTTELIVIADGTAYKSTDGGAKTAITGASFTAGNQCYFMQIAGYLYIANGVDSLARYDGSVLTTYSSINAPANLSASLVASGLASGTYTYYAEVTAVNEVGETTGSSEVSVSVNKRRDSWISTTDKVAWSWASVTGASRYQLYLAEESGAEVLLTSTTTNSYIDNGTLPLNEFVVPPLQNTTSAPKFKSMVVSGNRIWATNDPNDMYKVYWSGTGQYMGVFSDFYGGGWINLERGGREMPSVVVHYQSGAGEGRATALCRTPEGKGAVWQIALTTATVDTTSFSVPNAVKIVGSYGTDSLLGVVPTDNDIFFPNRNGGYFLGPEKNYYGLLRTREITSKIRPYWRSLNGSKLPGICGYFRDAKLFLSVPTTSTGNTRMIIYDMERLNWTVEWTIGAKQFLEYTDTTGITRFLYVPLTGNKLIELSENIQGDLGVAFSTDYTSGRIPLSKLWKDFMKVNRVYIKLGSAKGTINFEVSGSERTRPFRSLGSKPISPSSSNTGMGWDVMGDVLMGSTDGTPTTFSDSSSPYYLKIRKNLRDIQLRVTSNLYESDYILQGFIIDGVNINTSAPSTWKLS
jgi:hypothetical protein